MDLFTAIYQRRSTRSFGKSDTTEAVVDLLIKSAIQAPSAMNLQPWAFTVLHGRERLLGYSDRAKAHLLGTVSPAFGLDPRVDQYDSQKTNIFHGADTLILVCAKPGPFHPNEDCCLAAQNLMLAAHGLGLGSCPVGFARSWFNLPEIKTELGIPTRYSVVLPIAVGHPASVPAAVPRHEPEIIGWHWDR